MPPPLRVGLAGLGVVGSSVLRLLADNGAAIAERAGRRIEVVRVASRRAKPEVPLHGAAFSTDLRSLVGNDVDVVVELIGGDGAARQLAQQALSAGQPLITANKALLAACGDELFAQAHERGLAVGFEASVAGGIPIVNALRTGLAANRVTALAGIVNGTCNYILTAMEEDGWSFAKALATAQQLGYAEADPTFDIDGIDAAQKLAVLTALAFDTGIAVDDVTVEGIANLDSEDIQYARELGFAVKHLAIARLHEDERGRSVEARVHPALVPESALIAKVSGVMNAVLAQGDAVGPTLYIGAGAGGLPTASAVVADLVQLARDTLPVPAAIAGRLPGFAIDGVSCPHYLKVPAMDQPGVFAEVAEVLSRHDISIEAVIQRPQAIRSGSEPWVPIVILTNDVAEPAVQASLAELRELSGVSGEITRIRVADLDALAPTA